MEPRGLPRDCTGPQATRYLLTLLGEMQSLILGPRSPVLGPRSSVSSSAVRRCPLLLDILIMRVKIVAIGLQMGVSLEAASTHKYVSMDGYGVVDVLYVHVL